MERIQGSDEAGEVGGSNIGTGQDLQDVSIS